MIDFVKANSKIPLIKDTAYGLLSALLKNKTFDQLKIKV